MEITRTARAEGFELKLRGRMDATWGDHVARALAECVRSGHHTILMDMAQVDYLSSAGIRILVLYARQLDSIQGRLSVINASTIVRKLLELTGLDALLLEQAGPAASPVPATEASQPKVTLLGPGVAAEVFDLEPNASLRVYWPGDATTWFEGRTPGEACPLVEFPREVIGLGLGALVSGDSSNLQPFGEFLALTTLMVTHSLQQAVNLGDRIVILHQGRVAYQFDAADKQRLAVDDLLARFEELRRREMLYESAANLLKETYI